MIFPLCFLFHAQFSSSCFLLPAHFICLSLRSIVPFLYFPSVLLLPVLFFPLSFIGNPSVLFFPPCFLLHEQFLLSFFSSRFLFMDVGDHSLNTPTRYRFSVASSPSHFPGRFHRAPADYFSLSISAWEERLPCCESYVRHLYILQYQGLQGLFLLSCLLDVASFGFIIVSMNGSWK